jgi:ATP-dependent Lhr-like helicase
MLESEYVCIPAERLPQWRAVFADARIEPSIAAPDEFARVEWTRESALVELVRGRMTGLGPTAASAVAASLRLPPADIDAALLALESQGYVMRGRFTAAASADEWCERHLLARIHRYTIKRLRREIEPVQPRDFMRFLIEWQRVAPGTQVSGPDALAAMLAQLEGFEAAAAAWEAEILPARVAGYEISWLDDLCLAGRIVWTRMRRQRARDDGVRAGTPVRTTPIVLLQRRNMNLWNALVASTATSAVAISSRAQLVVDCLREHGALFFDELLEHTHLLHVEMEEALAELVAAGWINSDSFAGLRALLVPASKRPAPSRRRARRTVLAGIADAGRWSLLRRLPNAATGSDPDTVEPIVRTLLRRYGVICWRLLAREADWLPPWRELLRACHRLEARGEIRGGRFIAGLSGEQFALPEAIGPLRSVRARAHDGTLVAVSGADPLNLVGHIVAGAKVPSLANARVLYRDGAPIAALVGGEFTALETLDAASAWTAKSKLLRSGVHEATAAPAMDYLAQ